MELRCGRWQDVLQDVTECDSVITDPPFEAEAHTLQRRVKRGGNQTPRNGDGGIAEPGPLSFEPLSFEHRVETGAFIARVCKRWAIVFCQCEASQLWRKALEPMAYRRTAVWIKPDGMPQYSGDRPGMGYESLVCVHAKGRSRWNGGGRVGVFRYNKNSGGKHQHETQKPLPLMDDLVSLFTDPEEMILDPFAGSGTTLLAAARYGRRAIGAECDPETYRKAVKRLSAGYTPSLIQEAKPKPKQGAMF
jgi:site-specific DNA-methyltransferase (adenine-specific)